MSQLWVQPSTKPRSALRADRIVAFRIVRDAAESETRQCRVEAVTIEPCGEGESHAVPLCFGYSESFKLSAVPVLLSLMEHHINDPEDFLLIECVDEEFVSEHDDQLFIVGPL